MQHRSSSTASVVGASATSSLASNSSVFSEHFLHFLSLYRLAAVACGLSAIVMLDEVCLRVEALGAYHTELTALCSCVVSSSGVYSSVDQVIEQGSSRGKVAEAVPAGSSEDGNCRLSTGEPLMLCDEGFPLFTEARLYLGSRLRNFRVLLSSNQGEPACHPLDCHRCLHAVFNRGRP